MRIIDACLYRLAVQGTITLEEAKVLKALHSQRASTLFTLCGETGLEERETREALEHLKEKGIAGNTGGIWFAPNFEDSILGLISKNHDNQEKEKQFLLATR